MISAVNFPIKAIGKKKPEKNRASTSSSLSSTPHSLIFSGFFFPIV